MPKWKIQDPKTGRSVVVEGDSPPNEQELEQIFASVASQPQATPRQSPAGSGFGAVGAGYGIGRQPPRMDPQTSESLARYGVPVAATLLAGPGAGVMTLAALGGAGALVGEGIAQTSEKARGARQGYDAGEIASQGILGSIPFAQQGRMGTRIGKNVLASMAGQALAQGARGEGMADIYDVAPGSALALALSAFGRTGAKLPEVRKQAEAIAKERLGGTVALSDVFPGLAKLEAKRVAADSPLAKNLVENMDRDIAAEIFKRYGQFAEDSQITKEIAGLVGKLKPLQQQAVKAREAAAVAQQRLAQGLKEQSASLPQLMKDARQAAWDAQKAKYLYADGARLLGGKEPPLSAIAQGARMKRLSEFADSAKKSAKAGIDELFGETGIRLNDPVVAYDDAIKALRRQRSGPLSGREAKKEMEYAIRKGFTTLNRETGKREEVPFLTLEGYRRLRDNIAAGLAAEGRDANVANAVAADAYKVVRSAADKYIAREMSGDTLKAWKLANSAAADYFGARGSDAMEMVAKGDAAGLYSKIKAEGYGPTKDQIDAFEQAIKGSGNPRDPLSVAAANEAAKVFRRDVNSVLRDSVVDAAVRRGEGVDGLEAVDFNKLVNELQSLASKGFPIEQLGLGKPSEVKALARIAANRTFTKEDFGRFLEELPKAGRSAAEGRVDFFNELRKQTIAGGTRRAKTNAKLIAARNKAKLSADEAEIMLAEVQKDPVVRLLSDTKMQLSKDPIQNAGYSNKLLAMEPSTITAFKKAMDDSGRGATMRALEESATANFMRSFVKQDAGGLATVDTEKMVRFFDSPEFSQQKDALSAIMGKDAFGQLQANIVQPARAINRTRGNLVAGAPGLLERAGGAIRAKVASPGGVAFYSNPLRVLGDLVGRGQYHTAHKLFLDPNWAPEFAKAGYNIDKFVASQPVNATALRIWNRQDGETSPAP